MINGTSVISVLSTLYAVAILSCLVYPSVYHMGGSAEIGPLFRCISEMVTDMACRHYY